MTTEILDEEVVLPSVDLKTTGVLNLTRGLTQYEYDFLQTSIKSKFKRVFLMNKSRWVDSVIRDSDCPADLLNILSFVNYVGRTFITLDSKRLSTPEQVTSAINGLEKLFSLPVFGYSPKPVEIAFGSAVFRIGDKEFYRVAYKGGELKVQSGMLAPVWNKPITAQRENTDANSSTEVDMVPAMG